MGPLAGSEYLSGIGKVIDIETCSVCGGAMRIIACIEDPVVIGVGLFSVPRVTARIPSNDAVRFS
jgi:hypothetical protein